MKRALILCAALAFAGCDEAATDTLQGYGEAQYLYAASQDGGPLVDVMVKEGDRVKAGAPLFRTDPVRLELAAKNAEANAAAQRARVSPGGTLAEAVKQAQANADLARRNFQRTQDLVRAGNASKAKLDQDRGAMEAADAALAQARANLEAAQNDVAAAEANAALAQQRVADTEVKAPADGTVQRIYRRAGEVIGAGAPVLSLLPDAGMKVRFFVPEPRLAEFAVGTVVNIACDGCDSGLTARMTYVADEPQFTPPVIYSLEERQKLVFLAEALPEKAGMIRPGLPVDVTP